MAVRARFQNAGQSCIAAKRFIVVQEVADEFERLFAQAVSRLKVGNPLERDTQIGPMARGDLRDALDEAGARFAPARRTRPRGRRAHRRHAAISMRLRC